MSITRILRRRLWLKSGLVLPVVLAGCMCHGGACGDGACGGRGLGGGGSGTFGDRCATIPQGAIPQPVGTHTNELIARQVNKAEADQFVIYLYEWQGDTAFMGPFGARHVEHIALKLPGSLHPVVIEPDCDKAVNDQRRQTIVAYLQSRGIANANDIVRLGYPMAEGIYGDEAERIYRQMLRPQGAGGYGGMNTGGFQGGFGGAGALGGTGGIFGGFIR